MCMCQPQNAMMAHIRRPFVFNVALPPWLALMQRLLDICSSLFLGICMSNGDRLSSSLGMYWRLDKIVVRALKDCQSCYPFQSYFQSGLYYQYTRWCYQSNRENTTSCCHTGSSLWYSVRSATTSCWPRTIQLVIHKLSGNHHVFLQSPTNWWIHILSTTQPISDLYMETAHMASTDN